MTDNTTFHTLFARATSQTDVTNLNGVPAYYFGKQLTSAQILDNQSQITVDQNTTLALYYPDVHLGNFHANKLKWGPFQLVNGIPFWWMFGKATHTTPDTKQTITNFTNTEGRKPRIKSHKRKGDYTNQIYGCLINSLTLHYEQGVLQCALTGLGCKHEEIIYTSNTPSTITYPSDVESIFRIFDSATWNSVAISKSEYLDFKCSQNVKSFPHKDGYIADNSEDAFIAAGFTIGYREYNAALDADFRAKTARTLTFKFLKPDDPTKYFEVTAANTYCHINSDITIDGEVAGYAASFTCQSVSIVVQDAVDDDFYSIS